jgi:hypothetical protein
VLRSVQVFNRDKKVVGDNIELFHYFRKTGFIYGHIVSFETVVPIAELGSKRDSESCITE